MAHALAEKLQKFINAYARFERAYLSKRIRQTDFEIVDLQKSSAHLALNPVPRIENYQTLPALIWTFSQWEKIGAGQQPDSAVDEEMVAEIIDLARRPGAYDYEDFVVTYESKRIAFNQALEANAQALRAKMLMEERKAPWRSGVSLGTLTGELRTVMDANNEHQIVILPPIGPETIRCIFPESLRLKVRDCLWKFVRVTGVLHYTENSPFPILVEMDDIYSLEDEVPKKHISEGRGLFKDSYYPREPVDTL